jgi:hypothetical protein
MTKNMSIVLIALIAAVMVAGTLAVTMTSTAFAAEQCQTVNGALQCEGGTGGSDIGGPGVAGGGGSQCSGLGSPTFQCSGGGGFSVNPLSPTGSPGGFGGHSSCVDYFVCTSVGSPSQRLP